jgi:cohesin complex subunit SA-1/2
LREKRRAARRNGAKPKPKSKASHASKKPKVANGLGRQLAFRPATNGRLPAARSRKPKARPSLAAGERGLFGM